jgi:ubiquinone/menaquinone biosynthesis C-methylase UbiE
MENEEYKFYQNIKNWDFSNIKYEQENLTNWDMYEVLKSNTRENSVILDLGTGGGEKVINNFPKAKKIIATDYSEEMIKTARNNLLKSGRTDIEFRIMDNLKMDLPNTYFDNVVARHTIIDPKQIFHVLKPEGLLIARGVDKLDCWQLKRMFNKGQGYYDTNSVSFIDYNNIIDAGFDKVELIPIHIREYYKTKEDLLALLYKTPILTDFSEEQRRFWFDTEIINSEIMDSYIKNNTYEKGILLIRRYYGIVARKK